MQWRICLLVDVRVCGVECDADENTRESLVGFINACDYT